MDTAPVSLSQAAALLGTTQEAIRKRIKRGLLRAEKGEGGRWLVYMEADTAPHISGHVGITGHMEADILDTTSKPPSTPPACAQCFQLMIERAALTAQNEALTAQIIALQADREAWQAQAQAVLQTWNNQQSLSLPGAVKEMGKLTDGTTPRGLWARLRDAIKHPKD